MNMIIKKGSLVALSIALLCAITYVVLPAINMHSVGFWLLAAAVILIATGVYAIAGDAQKEKNRIGLKIGGGLIALIAIILVIGGISGSKLVNAKAYAAIMEVSLQPAEEYQISLDEVPLMDKATSTLLANRKMGTLVELVSQFEVDEYNNTQINYQGNPVRVIPLRYSGFIKWMANQTDGIPGYIIVDMKTQEAILVEVEGGINYSPSAYFGHNLARYVWMNSPTELYGGYSFEIDEEGNPVWIMRIEKRTVGMFGGTDLKAILIVDAVTGAITRHEVGNIPAWVDTAYSADMMIEQYDWHGVYGGGFWNSVFGQRNVVETTDGYNYIAFDGDIYMYTGITSVVSDESNIGFIFSNLRTKETVQYNYPSAEEYSAMDSAMGQIQHLGYSATFPILVRVDDELTYCMALKDAGGLVKMYAMVNAAEYQIVVTGATLAETRSAYSAALISNNIRNDVSAAPENTAAWEQISGTITDVRTAILDGSTYVYVVLDSSDLRFEIPAGRNKDAIFFSIGDNVSLEYYQGNEKDKFVVANIK